MKLNLTQTKKPDAKVGGLVLGNVNPTRTPDLKTQLAHAKETDPAKKPVSGLSLKSLLQNETKQRNAAQPATSATSGNTATGMQTTLNPQPKADTLNPPKQTTAPKSQSEIPTLAPITEKYVLVADASESLPQEVLDGFSERMQTLIDNMNSQELPTALHTLLRYTQENKNLRAILRETDVQLFVRACRSSYGLVVTKKTANKTRKTKSDVVAKELMNDLAELDFTI